MHHRSPISEGPLEEDESQALITTILKNTVKITYFGNLGKCDCVELRVDEEVLLGSGSGRAGPLLQQLEIGLEPGDGREWVQAPLQHLRTTR